MSNLQILFNNHQRRLPLTQQGENDQLTNSTEIGQSASKQSSSSILATPNHQENEHTNDIGVLIGSETSDDIRHIALTNPWIPPDDFTFPVSKTRNLKFKKNWLTEFHWLAYSKKYDGAYCRYCPFFRPVGVGRGAQAPKSLVTTAFNRWKDAKEQFRYHQDLAYHKKSIISGQHFIEVQEKKLSVLIFS